MPSRKIAKRSAAFETIKKLHECGELSDNLLPITKLKCVELFKDHYFRSWNQFKEGE